ncbi:Uncharacterised protein [Mycobacteroides abscessus subsp. abscessus]|nr:Uncharacterised protein [Mycobacteroides abscessus subsp. abscessus]
MTQPSDITKPSASPVNVWQRPVGESMRCCEAPTYLRGSKTRFTPPASTRSLSPAAKLWHPICTVASPAAHPASTVRDGPCTPRAYEIRPDAMQKFVPAKP